MIVLLVKITESGLEEPTSFSILHTTVHPDPHIPPPCGGPVYATVNHLFFLLDSSIVELV
jgi:hypothetical protein